MKPISFSFDTTLDTGIKMTIQLGSQTDTLLNLAEDNDAIALMLRHTAQLIETGKNRPAQRFLRFEEDSMHGQVMVVNKTNHYVQFEVWTSGRKSLDHKYDGREVNGYNTKLEIYDTILMIDYAKAMIADTACYVIDEEAETGALMNKAGYTFPVKEWKALKTAVEAYR